MTKGKRSRREPTPSKQTVAPKGKPQRSASKSAPAVSPPDNVQEFCGPLLQEIAIEMQAPLSCMLLGAQTLEKMLAQAKLDAPGLDRISQIFQQACQQQRYLVETLLALARTDSARALTVEPLILENWLPAALAAECARARIWQQQVSIVVPPDLPALATNGTILARILAELLAEASYRAPLGSEIAITVGETPAAVSFMFRGRPGTAAAQSLQHLQERDRPLRDETGLNLARKLALLLAGTLVEGEEPMTWGFSICRQPHSSVASNSTNESG